MLEEDLPTDSNRVNQGSPEAIRDLKVGKVPKKAIVSTISSHQKPPRPEYI
jgi:hypothetical protein